MSVLVALSIGGCATRPGMEQLENRLRDQEDYAADLEQQLEAVRSELKQARDEADAQRSRLDTAGKSVLVSEQADVLYRAEGIKFNSMLTSGADLDGQPGDEALSVLLMPVDAHGDLIKLVGAIELEVLDLDQPREAQRVGFWSFSPADVREHWHRGFLAGGYLFKLEWQQIPVSSELTLHGRLTAPDGRKFSTTSLIHVKPPSGSAAVAASPEGVPAPPADDAAPPPKRPAPAVPAAPAAPAVTPVARPADSQRSAARAGPVEVEARRLAPPDDSAGPVQTSDRWTEANRPRVR